VRRSKRRGSPTSARSIPHESRRSVRYANARSSGCRRWRKPRSRPANRSRRRAYCRTASLPMRGSPTRKTPAGARSSAPARSMKPRSWRARPRTDAGGRAHRRRERHAQAGDRAQPGGRDRGHRRPRGHRDLADRPGRARSRTRDHAQPDDRGSRHCFARNDRSRPHCPGENGRRPAHPRRAGDPRARDRSH